MTATPDHPCTEPSPGSHDVTCPTCGSTDMVPILCGLPEVTFEDKTSAGTAGETHIGQDQKAWRCRNCGTNSQDHPRPDRFAVWSSDATSEEIAAWVLRPAEAAGDEQTP